MKTNFLILGSDKDGGNRKHYNLECLLFFFKHMQLKHSEYVREAAAKGIEIVRRPDRKQLLAYLTEEVQNSNQYDKSVLFEIPATLKRAANNSLASSCTKKPRLDEFDVKQLKQQLAARLDGPKEETVCMENIRPLSDVMTADKIAAIKAKRLSKKRTSIKDNYDVEMTSDIRTMLDMDVEETKIIISRERQYRTKNTILQSRTKVFSSILGMLNNIKEREEKKEKMQPTPPNVAPGSIPAKPIPQLIPYNRYKQETFIPKTKEAGDFNIVTTGTYRGVSLTSFGEETAPPAHVKPPSAVGHLRARLGFHSLLPTPQQTSQNKRPSRTPIIIVPPNVSNSLITMDNAKDILQNLRYISSKEKRSQGIKRVLGRLIRRLSRKTNLVKEVSEIKRF